MTKDEFDELERRVEANESHPQGRSVAISGDEFRDIIRSARNWQRVCEAGDELVEQIMDIIGSRYEGPESYDDAVAREIISALSAHHGGE